MFSPKSLILCWGLCLASVLTLWSDLAKSGYMQFSFTDWVSSAGDEIAKAKNRGWLTAEAPNQVSKTDPRLADCEQIHHLQPLTRIGFITAKGLKRHHKNSVAVQIGNPNCTMPDSSHRYVLDFTQASIDIDYGGLGRAKGVEVK